MGFLLGGKFQLGLIAAVVLGLLYFVWDYQHTKVKLTEARAEAAAAKQEIKQMKLDLDTYKENQNTLNTMFAASRGLVIQQEKVKESIRNVPVKGTDRPFINDSGLLERARRLRSYQESSKAN